MDKISFVIPCYRSEKTILSVIDEIEKQMGEHKEYSYELVLVNDKSPDNVWQVIKNVAKEKKYIKAISFCKNSGQHSALMAGYRVADGDLIVSLDDDGQSPVDRLFDLIDKLIDGEYDVVYAKYNELKEAAWRRCGSWVNDRMTLYLLGKPKHISVTSVFVMRDFIKDEVIKYKGPYAYVLGLVLRSTRNVANVSVDHREREEGKSGYTFKKLISLWMNGFTTFSVIPLRVSSYAGFLCAAVGFILGIIAIIRKLVVPGIMLGWSSVIATIFFVGGLLMMMLGMIGEYIGRMYICINDSPQYVIKETINIEDGEK